METTQKERDNIRRLWVASGMTPNPIWKRALNDADRLAAIERQVRALIEAMDEPAPCDCIDGDGFIDCQCGNQDDYAEVKGWKSEQTLVRKLRAILDPPDHP